jgi:hypothetical protein
MSKTNDTVKTGVLARPVEKITASRLVEGSSSDVAEALRIRPDHLMALAFPGAGPSGDGRVDVILTARGWCRWLRIPARIEFRTPASGHTGAVIQLRWHARNHARLFPTMEADIMIRTTSTTGTELLLVGEYQPPLGLIGFLADRLIGGRAAISTAQAFLEDLAGAIASDRAVRSHPNRPNN